VECEAKGLPAQVRRCPQCGSAKLLRYYPGDISKASAGPSTPSPASLLGPRHSRGRFLHRRRSSPARPRRVRGRARTARGLPRIRFHALRHTAASLLLAEGVHPKVVQEILGHGTVSMTLDTYSHTTPAMHREAVATLDKVPGVL
jgi:integrase